METITFDQPKRVLALKVDNVPDGIGETFHKLEKQFGEGEYFGVSFCAPNNFQYFAAVEQDRPENDDQYQSITIPQGKYAAVCLQNWRENTDEIRNIFESMSNIDNVEPQSPIVEWYKNDREMYCMLKLK